MEGVDTYKRLRKNPFVVWGKTKDGAVVVGGFFEFVNGQGLPLDIVLYWFKGRGFVPEWLTFFRDTIEHGWNPQSTLTKIQVACEDVYGREYAATVIDKLKAHAGL